MYYEGKIKYNSCNESGKNTTVKEDYLIENCELHGEAESVLYKFASDYNLNDIDVLSVKRTKLMEFVNDKQSDDDYIYYATIASLFLDEKNGKEKETRYNVAVYAKDIDEANKFVNEYMKQGLNDMKLISIKRTKILAVIKY
jgi:predicted peroxiredoxin